MISMEMMGKIRRMYFRDKLSLHEIAKRTGLARNTIRKWVRAPEAKPPVYQRRAIFNKLSPFHVTLEQSGGTRKERMRVPLWEMTDDWDAWQPLHKEV